MIRPPARSASPCCDPGVRRRQANRWIHAHGIFLLFLTTSLYPAAAQDLSLQGLRTDGGVIGSNVSGGLSSDAAALLQDSSSQTLERNDRAMSRNQLRAPAPVDPGASIDDDADRGVNDADGDSDLDAAGTAPQAAQRTGSDDFDLFAGPATRESLLDTQLGRTVSPAMATRQMRSNTATMPAPRLGLTDSQPNEAAAPDGATQTRTAGAPRSASGRQTPSEALITRPNPPLAAGVAGEALSSASALRTSRPAEAIGRIIRRSARDSDPFAPVGIRAGNFVLYPELLQTIGASSNIDRRAGSSGGIFEETTVSARLLSDWSENEAEVNTSLTYRRNFSGEERDNPEAAADGRMTFVIDSLTTATVRGAFQYRKDDPDFLDNGVVDRGERPDVFTGSASGELAREFGRLVLSGTGTISRDSYDGLRAGEPDQDSTTLTAGLRTGYQLSPVLTPFLETSLGRRIFDQSEIGGSDGINRDSLLPSLRAGVGLDITEKLRGEVAVGYAWNRPDDSAARVTDTPTFDADLVWSPRRGTDVTLSARTSFRPEDTGISATVAYEGSLGIRHALTSRLELTAALTAEYDDSNLRLDDEQTFAGEAGFTYWLNRSFAMTGLYSHELQRTERGDDDWDADTIRLGIRMQR